MKRFLWTVIILAVVVVIVNDGVRTVQTYSDLNLVTNDLASWASVNGSSLSADVATQMLSTQAQTNGVVLVRYTRDTDSMHLWTQKDVTGTWVLGTVLAMKNGIPFGQARTTPFPVDRDMAATFQ